MVSDSADIPFLQRLAQEVTTHPGEEELIVVLPNKRSLFVLKEYVGSQTPLIQFFTADRFVETLTGFKLIEAEELLVTFFQAYRKLESEPQPFDEFGKWAVTLLRDFNETDLSLADPVKLFDYIRAYHQTGEGFTEGAAGKVERDFLSFWERIPRYYKGLREELQALKLAYRGMLYRLWAESDFSYADDVKGRTVFWVGLVPGNPAERSALERLKEHARVCVFADTDQYYLEHPRHEAGRLFRNDPIFKDHRWTVNLLAAKDYECIETPVPGKMAQVQQARRIVEMIPEREWPETAIVLLDEQLLSPLLDQFRDRTEHINVTMGYPLRSTQVHRFVMSLIQLHAGARQRRGEKGFYHLHLESTLQFQLVQEWFDQSVDWKRLQQEIVHSNLKFVPLSWLEERLVNDLFGCELFSLLFDWPLEATDVFQRLGDVLGHWKKRVETGKDRLEKQAIDSYMARLKLLIAQFNEVVEQSNYRALRQFVHRQVGHSRLYFEEPENEALQVMGMLETRMIDFRNLVVVGAAEHLLPGSMHRHTFIPYMHRKAFGMPVNADSEALMAYHFYRLLQRCGRGWFIYNNVADAFNSGEASPYLLQMREELARINPRFRFSTDPAETPQVLARSETLEITKSEAVMTDLKAFLQQKVSPSSINTYVNSPLEFYFYYVLGLREREQVEEEVEASTLGSIVHEVLEELYKPFLGRRVDTFRLESGLGEADERVRHSFLKHFPEEDLLHGKNYLRVALAVKFVEEFVRMDLREMKENGAPEIHSLEAIMAVPFEREGIRMRMLGFADRIDYRQETYRIVDYKTGLVHGRELLFVPDQFPVDSKWSKAFQLAFYKWAFCQGKGIDPERVKTSIVSFRNQRQGYLYLNEGTPATGFIPAFEEALDTIFREMLDDSRPFMHRPDSKFVTV